MRIEYVIVGFVIAMIVLLFGLSLLSGVGPGIKFIFNTTLGGV